MPLSATELAGIVGADRVATDKATLELFAHDIASAGAIPLAVVRPADEDQLAATVAAATGAGLAVYPRGGGHSYTAGYLADRPGGIVLDLTDLNRIIEIDDAARTVTVQAGCTWAMLYDALGTKGWRTPFFGPLSGMVATVGGSLSQDAAFFGSARHGTVRETVIGLVVIAADGRRLVTGGSGPDLTGLFVGDCGALGIKARATLRLIAPPETTAFASLDFPTAESLLNAEAALVGVDGLAEVWGFDPESHRNLHRTGFGAMEGAQLAADVARGGGLRGLAGLMRSGKAFVRDLRHSLHVVAEGDEPVVAHALGKVAEMATAHGGTPIPDTIPRVTRARPFRPIKALLGPDGENWLPVHGVFPAGRARDGYAAASQVLAEHGDTMAEHDIRATVLTVVAGASILVEPQLFWPDALNAFHRHHATPDQVKRHGERPSNPAAREAAHALRKALAAAMDGAGATNYQLGRTYDYARSLAPDTLALLRTVKHHLDPRGLINPGVLGL
ncbi:MAG: FAD-binding oxidoreductase [Alphaproteobacteria bacterium]